MLSSYNENLIEKTVEKLGNDSLFYSGLSMSESKSQASQIHFPVSETSGTKITDIINGVILESVINPVSEPPTFIKNNCITYNHSTQVVVNNVLQPVVNSGIFIYYFSCDFLDDPHPIPDTNNKCSFTHIYPFAQSILDIQRTHDSAFTGITTNKPVSYISGVIANKRATVLLEGENSLNKENMGSFSGAVKMNINSNELPILYIHNKKIEFIDKSDTDGNGVKLNWGLNNMEFNPINNLSPPAVNLTEQLTPIFRYCDLYCYGSYIFNNFKPTDNDIMAMVRWLYHASRNNDKRPFPTWANKT